MIKLFIFNKKIVFKHLKRDAGIKSIFVNESVKNSSWRRLFKLFKRVLSATFIKVANVKQKNK